MYRVCVCKLWGIALSPFRIFFLGFGFLGCAFESVHGCRCLCYVVVVVVVVVASFFAVALLTVLTVLHQQDNPLCTAPAFDRVCVCCTVRFVFSLILFLLFSFFILNLFFINFSSLCLRFIFRYVLFYFILFFLRTSVCVCVCAVFGQL